MLIERSMLIDKAYATSTTNIGIVLDDGDGHKHEDSVYHKSHGLNAYEGWLKLLHDMEEK